MKNFGLPSSAQFSVPRSSGGDVPSRAPQGIDLAGKNASTRPAMLQRIRATSGATAQFPR